MQLFLFNVFYAKEGNRVDRSAVGANSTAPAGLYERELLAGGIIGLKSQIARRRAGVRNALVAAGEGEPEC